MNREKLKEDEKLLKESASLMKVKEEQLPQKVEDMFNEWKEKRKQVKKMGK